jgi:hypothetical protein
MNLAKIKENFNFGSMNIQDIKLLIDTVEQQSEEIEKGKFAIVENCQLRRKLLQADDRIKELETYAIDLNETIFTLNMNEERHLEQNKKLTLKIRDFRTKTTYRVYEENLKLAQEVARLKGEVPV